MVRTDNSTLRRLTGYSEEIVNGEAVSGLRRLFRRKDHCIDGVTGWAKHILAVGDDTAKKVRACLQID